MLGDKIQNVALFNLKGLIGLNIQLSYVEFYWCILVNIKSSNSSFIIDNKYFTISVRMVGNFTVLFTY